MIYPESFEHKIGFDAIRYRLSELCKTSTGRQFVGDISFSSDSRVVLPNLHAATEMLKIVQLPETLIIHELKDVNEFIGAIRVPGTMLSPAELLDLYRMLVAVGETIGFFSSRSTEEGVSPYPVLSELISGFDPLEGMKRLIDRVIDRYGNVKDNASPELASIRREMSALSGRINSIMRKVIAKGVAEGVLEPDTNPTVRDGRLVLPVQPMYKRQISGIVHDESASGKTYFIEPAEIVQTNNRIRELRMDERREIARIMIMVADEIRPFVETVRTDSYILGRLDAIHAKAMFALEADCTMPHITEKPELEWYHAAHPVLAHSLKMQNKQIVPLDITLTPEKRILIISGPNAGGKSVCLKTVGVVQYMLQCGLLPPVYENSHMGFFDDIFIDIGDDQSLEDDLSTYSSHLKNMKYFLSKGGGKSIVLIDEFGGGTEPQIGGAIAQAILGEFNRNGMWGVITTHYQNLKHFAEETPGLVNGSMLYDRHLMQPMFKLSIGNPGSSFALEIARKIGLPSAILTEAERIVGSDYINLDKYLLDITRDKRYWENKRTEIHRKEKQLQSVIDRYQEDADKLREKRQEIISDARKEAEKILAGSNAAIERTIHDIKKAQAERQATLDARKKFEDEKQQLAGEGTADHPLLKKVPGSKKKKKERQSAAPVKHQISVGDTVRLDGEGTPGKVLEISGKNATVAFGLLKTTVSIERLVYTEKKIPGSGGGVSFLGSSTTNAIRERQLKFKQEIDVRGMRAEEALQAVTYFIDDAVQFNSGRVRILHGTGTGALRQSIRSYLATIPGVRSYHDEDVRFGGAGITVVELN
ncbi:MAG: Smr/MutS family protein [Muribaculaceae bacterium]|nr:Smr/MutS family protein [Muribaculaceae bacterium]